MTKSRKSHLKEIHEIPSWMIDSHHLKSGYRHPDLSFMECFFSIFRLHNETFNIWTHFLGAIFFIICGVFLSSILLPFGKISSDNGLSFKESKISTNFGENRADIRYLFRGHAEENKFIILNELNKKLLLMEEEIKTYTFKVLLLVQTEGKLIANRLKKNSKYVLDIINRFRLSVINSTESDRVFQVPMNLLDACLHQITLESLLRPMPHELEIFPILVFIASAVSCLGLSTMFHWFNPLDATVYKILHKLDYGGISLLNFGSSFAIFYYYFYCNSLFFWLSTGLIFIACFGVFVVSLTDWIDLPEHLAFKGLMYVGCLGIANIIPVCFIGYLIYSASETNDHISLGIECFLIMGLGATYLIGLIFYILKIPERFVPFKFDIWFNSHTIWHLFVFSAALQTFLALIYLYDKRRHMDCFDCVV